MFAVTMNIIRCRCGVFCAITYHTSYRPWYRRHSAKCVCVCVCVCRDCAVTRWKWFTFSLTETHRVYCSHHPPSNHTTAYVHYCTPYVLTRHPVSRVTGLCTNARLSIHASINLRDREILHNVSCQKRNKFIQADNQTTNLLICSKMCLCYVTSV